MWDTVLASMPTGMANSVRILSNKEKLVFVISGMKCETYIKEWSHIYHTIARFVHCMYLERAQQYDKLEVLSN